MKPVYFPFTYVNDAVARKLNGCFGQFAVYQPVENKIPENMQILSDEGIIDLKVPVLGDEERIAALIKEYEEWGELHQKDDTAFLKAIGERVPFFDETFSTSLASQIKKIRDGNSTEESANILFNARLFLCLAQDYDIMQERINRDLVSVLEMERNLLAGLTDEDEIFFTKKTGGYLKSDDPGRYKIKERVEAWTYLLSKDSEPKKFFITSNRDIFDFVVEQMGNTNEVIEIAPSWICDYYAEKEPEGEITMNISGIVVKSVNDFISKILSGDYKYDMMIGKSETKRGIFICLCELPDSTC